MMNDHNLQARLVSSLEKGILTDPVEKYPALEKISVLRGERLNFQLFLRTVHVGCWSTRRFEIAVEGLDATAREVKNVYAELPGFNNDRSREEGMIVESPSGLYPSGRARAARFGRVSAPAGGKALRGMVRGDSYRGGRVRRFRDNQGKRGANRLAPA